MRLHKRFAGKLAAIIPTSCAAMNASTQFVLDHPQDVLPILAKETRIDQAVLSQFFPRHYVISTTVRPEEIQGVIDFMARQKQIDKGFSAFESWRVHILERKI